MLYAPSPLSATFDIGVGEKQLQLAMAVFIHHAKHHHIAITLRLRKTRHACFAHTRHSFAKRYRDIVRLH